MDQQPLCRGQWQDCNRGNTYRMNMHTYIQMEHKATAIETINSIQLKQQT